MSHYRIRGQTVDWFQSFFSHRVQYTLVSGFDSELSLVTHDVTQGSALEPLLFIIFINDLQKSVKHSQILHFADDTDLLYSNKSIKKNQQTYKSWSQTINKQYIKQYIICALPCLSIDLLLRLIF